MNDASTPVAGIGHNRPLPYVIADEEDLPILVDEYLKEECGRFPKLVADLFAEANLLPKKIENEETLGKYAALIKRFRDAKTELEANHGKEKAPYFRSSQAVDNFFFALISKCMKRSKTDQSGAADILQAQADDYIQRKLAAEQERRRQEAIKAQREADEKRRTEEETARKAEADRAAAERARAPAAIEAKEAVADKSEAQASAATVDANLAAEKAQAAHIDTLAKPADLVRTRYDAGPTVTMAQEAYAIVTDYDALDLAVLRPFIAQDALDKALRAWAKVTSYNAKMAGAEIGRRAKTVIR